MRELRAICLDLDDTLWDLPPVLQRADRAFHAWLGVHYPAITERHSVTSLQALRTQVVDDFPERRHDVGALRRELYGRLAREAGYGPAMVAAGFAEFQRLRNAVTPFADVVPALERLARRHRLVALTNGNADLDIIGLDGYFSRVYTAAALGVAKPEAAVFAAVCADLDLPPATVLHVGNDPENDVLGPARAGLPAVWMNRTGSRWPGDAATPLHTVHDLGELADWLDC
jgi:putative hydrolase of the HAD superfamily